MQNLSNLIVCLFLVFSSHGMAFVEKVPTYGIIKPGSVTTPLAANNGMVERIPFQVGDSVRRGQAILIAIERETTRAYRSSISGQVAKIHVTKGAVVSPGMPLVTVVKPSHKLIEVHLSPQEAQLIRPGSLVDRESTGEAFGKISKISPLVDPDTGAVTAYIKPLKAVRELIGDVISLNIHSRTIKNCKVVELGIVDEFIDKYKVEAVSGTQACLLPKAK